VAKGSGGARYVFARIETDDGRVGWGETIALPSWSYETVESITSTIRQYLAPILKGRSAFDQAWFQRRFDDVLTPAISNGFPFAKSAVLTAALDLAGQIAGVPVHRLLGGKIKDEVALSFALSIDEPAAMAAAAKEWPSVTCFKVKVAGDPQADGARVRAVAEARPGVDIWIDANQSYRPIYFESFLREIGDLRRVRCIEQPTRSVDWEGLGRARMRSHLAIAVDEGCFSPQDVARLAGMKAADLVVLKVAKSGGVLNCQRSAAVAEAHGLGLLGSGMTESGVGLIAAVHLFSTMDLLLPPELNGPRFLKDLLVDGLSIRDGNVVRVPDTPGLGVRVKEDALRALSLNL
jgi:muconate cycloisomerase